MISRQQGMTLVEVTVATVIFSLILSATVTAFRTFAGTYQRLELEVSRSTKMREADRFLRSVIRDALNRGEFFKAGRSSLQWVAPIGRVGGVVGLQHLRLYVKDRTLMLAFAPLAAPNVTPDWGVVASDFPLVTEVDDFQIAYLATPDGAWVEDAKAAQSSANGVPAAIALNVLVGGVVWPPIVVTVDQFRRQL